MPKMEQDIFIIHYEATIPKLNVDMNTISNIFHC